MKKELLSLAFAAISFWGMAQSPSIVSDYTRVYGGFATMSFDKEDSSNDNGVNIGVLHGLNLMKGQMPLFLQVGAELNYLSGSEQSLSETFVNMAIPVNLSYKFGTDELNIEPFCGVNFRLNIKGELEEKENGVSVSVDYFDVDELEANRFQFGANLGANVNIRQFTVGYRFNPDLTDYFGATKSKFNNHFITVGYIF